MMSVRKVAEYFLAKADDSLGDGISNLKLQKLVYYAQGFHLALHGGPLFGERIEAWEHGPVVPELYRQYREFGSGNIPSPAGFDPDSYDAASAELLDEVYDVFGQYSAWKLRNMTHEDRPWIDAYEKGEPRPRDHARRAARLLQGLRHGVAGVARFVSPHAKNRGARIQPRESATGSTDGLPPVFCLRFLTPPFCVTSCERNEQASFALTLKRLSTMTWAQIRNSPRHGLGSEKIGRDSIRAPIPAGITDDVDFIAIRFHALAPMVGFRSNQTLHVVWLDRAFTLYAH